MWNSTSSTDDYAPLPPSERNLLGETVAEFIRGKNLAGPKGGVSERDPNGKYYGVRFASAKFHADGEIRVYGPDYLIVFWRGRVPGLDGEGRRLLGSAEEMMAFLTLSMIEGRGVEAMQIPERQSKRRVKRAQAPPRVRDPLPDLFPEDYFTGSTEGGSTDECPF